MNFSRFKLALLGAVVLFAAIGCGGSDRSEKVKSAAMKSESDSLAYIMGLSVAQNLVKMDSTVNLAVVATAISQFSEGKAVMSVEDAKTAYLRYILHVEPERRRGYEDRYLEELSQKDRSFTRTKSGLTYNIVKIGDEKLMPRNVGDWVEYSYSVNRINGESVIVSENYKGGFSNLPKGIMEALKLIGKGGEIKAWIPSKLAYGDDGDKELQIEPFETMLYDIKLSTMERNGTNNHKAEEKKNF